jgi:hypothetical protein
VPLPLCRSGGHTCAACCFGEDVKPHHLRAALRRQTRLFHRHFTTAHLPGRLSFLRYELSARRGLDLLLALLLLLPIVGDLLRLWLKRRMTCAFLGFEDGAETRVGCLLHPSRWGGQEVRPRVAFGWLPGFGCGSPDWYCTTAHRFTHARWEERREFTRATAGLGWYQYSRALARMTEGHFPSGRET